MSKSLLSIAAAGVTAAVLGLAQAQAARASTDIVGNPMLIHVSGGCGPYGWRGRYNRCHYHRGTYWRGNGCPPGSWRGPWGHCRNTPYHGNLPGGGYKP